MVGPCVKFKAVEGDTLPADLDRRDVRPDFGIEAVAIHAEITRRIAKAEQARHYGRMAFRVSGHGAAFDGPGLQRLRE
jgi:hypothetical protein